MAVTTDDGEGKETAPKSYVERTKVGNQTVEFVTSADVVKMFENKYMQKVEAKADSFSDTDQLEKAIAKARKDAIKAAYVYEQNVFNRATSEQKKKIIEMRRQTLREESDNIKKLAQMELATKKEGSKAYQKILGDVAKQEAKARQQEEKLIKSRQEVAKGDFDNRVGGFVASRKSYASTQREALTEYRELARQAKASGDTEGAKRLNKEAARASQQAAFADAQVQLLTALNKTVAKIDQRIGSSVDDAMGNISRYLPQFSSRLQGSGKDFSSISALVKQNLAVSPFLKQTTLLENISKGVSKGIAYNLESRAFLASFSDRIIDTFDAFDENMSRLIRLQQADSSMARLGMEASLTKTFNAMFSDTSYLSSAYDTVSAALLDASAQMSRDEAVEFEYTVQKWLGSLYSLGLSDAFVGQVAQGLNYLGTGNVQALAGNSGLQTLLAMSASRANLPYGDTLIGGLTASKTNALLQSMVKYLQEIAGDTNKVVKSAYGDILGLSLSDLQAVRNLTSADIRALSEGHLSYSGAISELDTQLGSVVSRTSMSQLTDNLFSNALYSVGSQIAENPATYALWKVVNMIKSATGGIHLPAVSVMGNMVDLSAFTIEGMMKSGIVGLSSLSLIPAIFSSLGNLGGLSPKGWGFDAYNTRGTGMGLLPGSAFSSGVSTSGYVGSGSGEDAKKAALSSATEEAGETAKITNKDMGTEHNFEDLYKALFVEPVPIEVKVAQEVQDRLESLLKDVISAISDNGVMAIVKESNDEKGLPVIVINTDRPIEAKVTNTEIVDYYASQSVLPITGITSNPFGL